MIEEEEGKEGPVEMCMNVGLKYEKRTSEIPVVKAVVDVVCDQSK